MNSPDINLVIRFMGSEPLYLDCPKRKNDTHYQAIPVSHDVKNDPVVCNQTSVPVYPFEFLEIPKLSSQHLMIPLTQCNRCARIFPAISQ